MDNKIRRATMVDVARAAGVSHQTVSRVINGSASVSPGTRDRVLLVIKQLNYYPNRAARSLAARQTRTLALITYDLSYYGPTQMVVHIERAARQAGYDLMLANMDPSSQDDLSVLAGRIGQWAIDGALLLAPVVGIAYTQLAALTRPIPLLLIDVEPGASVPSVIIDQQKGSMLITDYLIRLGHRSIGHISGPQEWYGAVARQQGFLQAMAEQGLEPVACMEGAWTAESGYQAALYILDNSQATAIVAANDQMALGAIAAAAARGLRVPEDLSIVGFDDLPEARYFSPPLTTVRQDFSALGRCGLQRLLYLIENPDVPCAQHVIDTDLVIRQSVAPPPGSVG